MYGTIIGDMTGSIWEFSKEKPPKKCKMLPENGAFTDDTVMTVAVANALIIADTNREDIKRTLIREMHMWGLSYPDVEYDERFLEWIKNIETEPYGSFGNGSAMRVSPVGWMYPTIKRTRDIARITSEVTHDHPDAIIGAEAVASAIFMARNGSKKDEIKQYIQSEFGYDLDKPVDEIRKDIRDPSPENVSCKKTVPEAFIAFLNGKSFVDVIQTAVSFGGDTDTIAAIAGSIAEGYFRVPRSLIYECEERLPNDMLLVLRQFQTRKYGGASRCQAEEDSNSV